MRRIACLALLLAGCSSKANEPWEGPTASTGPVERVTVSSIGVVLDVPTGTHVEYLGGGATFFLEPDTRRNRAFSIEQGLPAVVHESPVVQQKESTLKKNRSTVRYSIRLADEGSGGVEGFLDGVIVVDQDVFAIHCHDQAEPPGRPEPEWCFEWLATAKRDER